MQIFLKFERGFRIGNKHVSIVFVWGVREIVHTINHQRLDYGFGVRFGKFFIPFIIRKRVAPIRMYDIMQDRWIIPCQPS